MRQKNRFFSRPTEYPLYGSSRLGNYIPQANKNTQAIYTLQSNFVRNYLAPTFNQNTNNTYLNSRNYELNDHLGNVTATVSDYKTNQKVQLLTAHVYYPFGMEIQSRSAGNYRYGFNGKELDPEGMGGGGSTYDYGFRIYNPQLAKFLSVDPLTKSYPMLTPYQFASNQPIWAIDLDGLERQVTIKRQSSSFNNVPNINVVEEDLVNKPLNFNSDAVNP